MRLIDVQMDIIALADDGGGLTLEYVTEVLAEHDRRLVGRAWAQLLETGRVARRATGTRTYTYAVTPRGSADAARYMRGELLGGASPGECWALDELARRGSATARELEEVGPYGYKYIVDSLAMAVRRGAAVARRDGSHGVLHYALTAADLPEPEVVELLREEGPLTAPQVAERMGCLRQTALARLHRWARRVGMDGRAILWAAP